MRIDARSSQLVLRSRPRRCPADEQSCPLDWDFVRRVACPCRARPSVGTNFANFCKAPRMLGMLRATKVGGMWVQSREEYHPHTQPTVTLLTFSVRNHSYLPLRTTASNTYSLCRTIHRVQVRHPALIPFSPPLIGMHEPLPVMCAHEVRKYSKRSSYT
jgi:hypothetical protein